MAEGFLDALGARGSDAPEYRQCLRQAGRPDQVSRQTCPCRAELIYVSECGLSRSDNVRADAGRNGRREIVAGGQAMTFHEYLSAAVQNDAQLAAQRDRLVLVARRARRARRRRVSPAVSVSRLARLLLRRAPA
jgi:hypothetical protein